MPAFIRHSGAADRRREVNDGRGRLEEEVECAWLPFRISGALGPELEELCFSFSLSFIRYLELEVTSLLAISSS